MKGGVSSDSTSFLFVLCTETCRRKIIINERIKFRCCVRVDWIANRLCLHSEDHPINAVKGNKCWLILISNFRRVLNAVLCLLGNLPASELLVPTFRILLAVPFS